METKVLTDKTKLPTPELLKEVLGSCYKTYEALLEIVTKPETGLEPQWNYYNDGKSWLCKVVYKKKTIFWLSVWEKYFKITFYYTEKNIEGVYVLDIDEDIKRLLKSVPHIGKFIPLTLTLTEQKQLIDVAKIVEYKKSLK